MDKQPELYLITVRSKKYAFAKTVSNDEKCTVEKYFPLSDNVKNIKYIKIYKHQDSNDDSVYILYDYSEFTLNSKQCNAFKSLFDSNLLAIALNCDQLIFDRNS